MESSLVRQSERFSLLFESLVLLLTISRGQYRSIILHGPLKLVLQKLQFYVVVFLQVGYLFFEVVDCFAGLILLLETLLSEFKLQLIVLSLELVEDGLLVVEF